MSQSKTSSSASLGEVFFRFRDYTPIPLILFLFMLAQPTVFSASLGMAFIFFGEFLRIYSVSFIGPKSRTRGKGTGDKLIQEGPYSLTRNPLYLANFLICLGFSCYSGRLWFLLFVALLFFVQYYYIIQFEEETLKDKFGKDYESYCKKVPQLFPKTLPNFEKLPMSESFFASLKTEKRTLTSILILLILLMVFS